MADERMVSIGDSALVQSILLPGEDESIPAFVCCTTVEERFVFNTLPAVAAAAFHTCMPFPCVIRLLLIVLVECMYHTTVHVLALDMESVTLSWVAKSFLTNTVECNGLRGSTILRWGFVAWKPQALTTVVRRGHYMGDIRYSGLASAPSRGSYLQYFEMGG